ARVLRPGGRMGVSDVVSDDDLTPAERAVRGSFAGCIAGALSLAEYRAGREAVGLTDVSVTSTHAVGAGLHAAIVRAAKPAGWTAALLRPVDLPAPPRGLPTAAEGSFSCGGAGCCRTGGSRQPARVIARSGRRRKGGRCAARFESGRTSSCSSSPSDSRM